MKVGGILAAAAALLFVMTGTVSAEGVDITVGAETEAVVTNGFTDDDDVNLEPALTVGINASTALTAIGDGTAGVTVTGELTDGAYETEDGNVWLTSNGLKLVVGDQKNAAWALGVTAPDVGTGLNASSFGDLVHPDLMVGDDSAYGSTLLMLSDDWDAKASVYAAVIDGVMVGFSYVPNYNDVDDDAWFFGTRAELGELLGNDGTLTVSTGYAITPNGMNENDNSYSIGAQIDMGDTTVGASFAATQPGDATGVDVGASYDVTEAFAVSLSHYIGEYMTTERQFTMLSGAYELAGGIDVYASAAMGDVVTDVERDGTIMTTGLRLEF